VIGFNQVDGIIGMELSKELILLIWSEGGSDYVDERQSTEGSYCVYGGLLRGPPHIDENKRFLHTRGHQASHEGRDMVLNTHIIPKTSLIKRVPSATEETRPRHPAQLNKWGFPPAPRHHMTGSAQVKSMGLGMVRAFNSVSFSLGIRCVTV
jgi:hypothetical protein